MRADRFMETLRTSLVQLIWPRFCVSCGQGGNRFLCKMCLALSAPHLGPRCKSCDDASVWPKCNHCRARGSPRIAKSRGVWRYSGPIKVALRMGKHGGLEAIWKELAQTIPQDLWAQKLLLGCDLIVPMPLSPKRRWQRGYNPCVLLARALAQSCNKEVAHVLRRAHQHRPPQSTLRHEERMMGMEGAFTLTRRAHACANKTVLLVDDVSTTFTTLHAAAEPILQAGARQVWALTLARQILETMAN